MNPKTELLRSLWVVKGLEIRALRDLNRSPVKTIGSAPSPPFPEPRRLGYRSLSPEYPLIQEYSLRRVRGPAII